MDYKYLVIIFLSSVFVNNYVLNQFYGICPFLGVSKKIDQATGMGFSVAIVMLLASAVTWPIQEFVLNKLGLEYMQNIVFILVIASLVQMLELVLKRLIPSLYKGLGVYLPLITTNCAVLAVTINNIQLTTEKALSAGPGFLLSMVNALGAGLGFLLAMVLFSGLRSRIDESRVPKPFRGIAITLISASFLSLAFMGFSGIVEKIFA